MSLRILMSTVPGCGYLFPMLPLARALRARGHAVAVLTSADLAWALEHEDVELLAAGPSLAALAREVGSSVADSEVNSTPEFTAEVFAGVRVDLTVREAMDVAHGWEPDLLVHDYLDLVGPMVASAAHIPFATLALGPGLPAAVTDAINTRAKESYASLGIELPPQGAAMGNWYLDLCPPALQQDAWQPPAPRIGLRPEPHSQAPSVPVVPPASDDRPTILVTFGTFFTDPMVISSLLRGLQNLDVNVLAPIGLGRDAAEYDVDPEQVRLVPFAPMAALLPGVSAVITHGGVGTILAALSRGIPLIVVPQGADQFRQAERVTSAGVAVSLLPGRTSADDVADAVRQVLASGSGIPAAAHGIGAQIASMPSPSTVAALLEEAITGADFRGTEGPGTAHR
ncbi:glycosyltransferase [Streptomyces sp. NPDC055189]